MLHSPGLHDPRLLKICSVNGAVVSSARSPTARLSRRMGMISCMMKQTNGIVEPVPQTAKYVYVEIFSSSKFQIFSFSVTSSMSMKGDRICSSICESVFVFMCVSHYVRAGRRRRKDDILGQTSHK